MNNNTWEKGCDMGFTVGQRVWGIHYGWGTVVSICEHETYPIKVNFDVMNPNDKNSFMRDGCAWNSHSLPTIFHVEQTFDYSRHKWQPEPGQLVWAWYSSDILPTLAKFHRMNANLYRCFNMSNFEVDYRHIAPFNNGQLPEQFLHLLKGGCE